MKKILVVDDTPVWRQLSLNLLSEAGYGVIEADSGEQAIELARSHSPLDLVVLDFGMPELNGIDTAGFARQFRRANSLLNSGPWC